jgi:two-component system cell cycle sensor histidine kinase/response regulator CckA
MDPDKQRDTILIVDDNPDICALARAFLESAGYNVLTAADGEEGLRVFERHQSSIGLLLTDVTMPKMNGFALADRVFEIDSQLSVLFMSGDAQNFRRGLGCVAKPFDRDELLSWVSRAVSAPGKHGEKAARAASGRRSAITQNS